jgi:hypothetical protein
LKDEEEDRDKDKDRNENGDGDEDKDEDDMLEASESENFSKLIKYSYLIFARIYLNYFVLLYILVAISENLIKEL